MLPSAKTEIPISKVHTLSLFLLFSFDKQDTPFHNHPICSSCTCASKISFLNSILTTARLQSSCQIQRKRDSWKFLNRVQFRNPLVSTCFSYFIFLFLTARLRTPHAAYSENYQTPSNKRPHIHNTAGNKGSPPASLDCRTHKRSVSPHS